MKTTTERTPAPATPDPPAGEDDHLAHVLQQAEAIEGEAVAAAAASAARAAEQEARAQAAALDANAREWRSLLDMARMTAAPAFTWWPDFGRCWSDQQLDQMAQAWAAVSQLHGWSAGQLLGRYAPYIAAAASTLPPAIATFAAVRQRRDELGRGQGQHPRPEQQATP